MSRHLPLHATVRSSFHRPGAHRFTHGVLPQFSKADTFPSNSPPALKSNQTTHGILPHPALSPLSRPHPCTNPTLAFLEELRYYFFARFGSIRTGVADIASYQAFWLVSYFILNLVLTLYNKILLVSFPYPYTLTAVHAIFGLVGGTCLRLQNVYQPKSLWGSDYALLLAYSLLYSVNIAVSNASLDLVTVPVRLRILGIDLTLKRI